MSAAILRGRSDRRLAGGLLTFAGLEMLLAVTALESWRAGYSVHADAISDLLEAGTGTSLVAGIAGLAFALSWLVGGYLAYGPRDSGSVRVLNVLPGVGVLLAVVSPENVNLVIHSVGAILAFLPGSIAAMYSYRTTRSDFRYFALPLGVLSFIGIVVEFGAYGSPLVQHTLGPGGWERVIFYPLLLWLVGYGSYLSAELQGPTTAAAPGVSDALLLHPAAGRSQAHRPQPDGPSSRQRDPELQGGQTGALERPNEAAPDRRCGRYGEEGAAEHRLRHPGSGSAERVDRASQPRGG